MLDRDLAVLYGVTTSNLNKAVMRNIKRFPDDFMFILSDEEWKSYEDLIFQNGIPKHGGSRFAPHAFTEHGVVVLANILKSEIAIEMSIRITRAFVQMRHNIISYIGHEQRIVSIEKRLIETDQKIDHVLNCLEEGTLKEKAHIFSAGQIYEARSFIADLISKAKSYIILIDGYIGPRTIDLLNARAAGVRVQGCWFAHVRHQSNGT